MTQRIYEMMHSCPQWETCPHFHEARSLPLTGYCTICLEQSRCTPPWCGGKAGQAGEALAGHCGHPWFWEEQWQRVQYLLAAPALLLGPALRFSLYTQRAEILFSSPFFSFEEQLLGQHGAVQYRLSFWPRLLINKAIKLMAGTFPKSLRAVAGTSTLGTDTQSIFQNIKKKNPFKIPLPRCLRSP